MAKSLPPSTPTPDLSLHAEPRRRSVLLHGVLEHGGVGIEGPSPGLHERGRPRQVEVRELGIGEGAVAERRDRGGDHERARKVGAEKGTVPDHHE